MVNPWVKTTSQTPSSLSQFEPDESWHFYLKIYHCNQEGKKTNSIDRKTWIFSSIKSVDLSFFCCWTFTASPETSPDNKSHLLTCYRLGMVVASLHLIFLLLYTIALDGSKSGPHDLFSLLQNSVFMLYTLHYSGFFRQYCCLSWKCSYSHY